MENVTTEIWRPCPGFQRYEVSSLGRIRSIYLGAYLKKHVNKRGGGCFTRLYPDEAIWTYLTKPRKDKHGRTIYRIRYQKSVRTARLIAIAFLGEPPTPKHQVDHIDCDKTNEAVTNLEWVTQSENIQRAYHNGCHKDDNTANNFQTDARYVAIKAMVRSGVSQVKTAKHFGLNNSTVSKIMAGKCNARYRTISETL